ncbi:hypothetical protein GCM10010156_27520 [Planobispora rosea]|uniref:Uncharacterized protein n=1 Tax=Planobispora rosea TaxID=35762 RepID=A0A8J3WCM0_PLARO|nr:hypothetical protein [Planobispora rosea]GGS67101.1 hypothetical protein GCM10010156_27520 [Planobispora rosea]GIH85114.1 hypothetical protein Pro02_35220 [Planobispora rosea]
MSDTEREDSWASESDLPADQRMEDAVGSAGSVLETSYPDAESNPADRAHGVGSGMPPGATGLGETTGEGADVNADEADRGSAGRRE